MDFLITLSLTGLETNSFTGFSSQAFVLFVAMLSASSVSKGKPFHTTSVW